MDEPNEIPTNAKDCTELTPGLIARLDRLSTSLERIEGLVDSIAERLKDPVRPATTTTEPRAAQEMQAVQRSSANETDVGEFSSTILKEDIISFVEASKLMPPEVRRHPATFSRWASTGVLGVILESVYVGGRRVTSKQALTRFLAACRKRDFRGIVNGHQIERAMAAVEQLRVASNRHGRD